MSDGDALAALCERVDRQLVENGWDPYPEFPSLQVRSLLKRQHAIRNKLTDLETRMATLEDTKYEKSDQINGWSANEIRLLHDTFSVELTDDGRVRVARGILKASPIVHRISIPPPLGVQLFGQATYQRLLDTAQRDALIRLAKDRLHSIPTGQLHQLLFPSPPPPPPPPSNDFMDRKHSNSLRRTTPSASAPPPPPPPQVAALPMAAPHPPACDGECGESCFVCERCERCCFECNCLGCLCTVCTIVNNLLQLKLPNIPASLPPHHQQHHGQDHDAASNEACIWTVCKDGRQIRCGPVSADLSMEIESDAEWLKGYLLNGCRMFVPELNNASCEVRIVSATKRLATLHIQSHPEPAATGMAGLAGLAAATVAGDGDIKTADGAVVSRPSQMVFVFVEPNGTVLVRVLPEQLGAESIVSATLLADDLRPNHSKLDKLSSSSSHHLYEVQRHSHRTCSGDCTICNLVWSSREFSRLDPFHIYTCRPQPLPSTLGLCVTN
jgi:hypothetical protein